MAGAGGFFLLAVVAVYCGVAFGLSSGRAMSPANTQYALLRGCAWGCFVGLAAGSVALSDRDRARAIGLLVGAVVELLLFGGYFVNTAAIAPC